MKSFTQKRKPSSLNYKTKKKNILNLNKKKNNYLQSGGSAAGYTDNAWMIHLMINYEKKIPVIKIPQLINIVIKNSFNHPKMLDRILEFPIPHKYEILIAMLSNIAVYENIFRSDQIKKLLENFSKCGEIVKCFNFANALHINHLLHLFKSETNIYNNFIQIIAYLRPLFFIYLEEEYLSEGVVPTIPEPNIKFNEICNFLNGIKTNKPQTSGEIEKNLLEIKKLLTFAESKEHDYTYQFRGQPKQVVNKATLYNYIISVLLPNPEITRFMVTTEVAELKSFFPGVDTVILPAVNSTTLQSTEPKDILAILERIYKSKDIKWKGKSFEFVFISRLLDTKLPPAHDIFEKVIKIFHQYIEHKNQPYQNRADEYRDERSDWQDNYDYMLIGPPPTPDHTSFNMYEFNYKVQYLTYIEKVNNLLEQLESIITDNGTNLLDIYLTRKIYNKYITLFNKKKKYSLIDGATIPVSWLKKNPDILFYKISKEAYKYEEDIEFKKIVGIFKEKTETTSQTKTDFDWNKHNTFNHWNTKYQQLILKWILNDCPITLAPLTGDRYTITGCETKTLEDLINTLKTDTIEAEINPQLKSPLPEYFIRVEKIPRTRTTRFFRKLKKIFFVKKPNAKMKAIINFHLMHGSEILNEDVFKVFILLAIRDYGKIPGPKLHMILKEPGFLATAGEPASRFIMDLGGAAPGGRAGHTDI